MFYVILLKTGADMVKCRDNAIIALTSRGIFLATSNKCCWERGLSTSNSTKSVQRMRGMGRG